MRSLGLPTSQLSQSSWFPFSDEPLLEGPWYAPSVTSPVFLFPQESPDDTWHVFVHSWIGIHHYKSNSGIVWEPVALIQWKGKDPFLYKEDDTYYLLYERHGGLIPLIEKGSKKRKTSYTRTSHIEMRTSHDLLIWSEPRLLCSGDLLPCASDFMKKPSLRHPQLVSTKEGYRLYVGASSVSGKPSFSRYVSSFFSPIIEGPYEVETTKPLIEPLPNDPYRSLASGRLSVVPGESGGYAAMQIAQYWDKSKKRISSAMMLLQSSDGLQWSLIKSTPILVPPDSGWASLFITSCDFRYKEDESCWYCYFSANGGDTFGLRRESVGLLIGKDPSIRSPLQTERALFI